MLTITMQEIPPTDNRIFRTFVAKGRAMVYKTKEAKDFTYRLQEMIPKPRTPFKGDIKIKIHYTFPDQRRKDVTNFNKLILDAFNKIVYEDDSQVVCAIFTKTYIKNIAKTEIIVEVV